MDKRTALIWGSTGQDGGYLSELLLSKGYHVIGVARRTSVDNTWRLAAAKKNPEFQLEQGDVTDAGCVQRMITSWCPDEVYNLAAQSHVGTSFEQPSLTTDVVYRGLLNILETVKSMVPDEQPKVYQASSSEMFGSAFSRCVKWGYDDLVKHSEPGEVPDQSGDYQDEDTPMRPNSPYAVAKLAAHHLCRIYRDAYGIFACSGILFNHESPRRGDTFVTKKIALWAAGFYRELKKHFPAWPRQGSAEQLLRDKPELRISLGNLDAKRDWGFAGDYVEAMWLMLQQDKPDDFVIATGETHSVREFLSEALAVIGCPANIPLNVVVSEDPDMFRPCEVPFLRGEAGKAAKVLGWKPWVTFKDLGKLMVYSELR